MSAEAKNPAAALFFANSCEEQARSPEEAAEAVTALRAMADLIEQDPTKLIGLVAHMGTRVKCECGEGEEHYQARMDCVISCRSFFMAGVGAQLGEDLTNATMDAVQQLAVMEIEPNKKH